MSTAYSSVMFFSNDKKDDSYESVISKIISKTQELTSKELEMPFDGRDGSKPQSSVRKNGNKKDSSE